MVTVEIPERDFKNRFHCNSNSTQGDMKEVQKKFIM
mgnify:CR=1 FL=1